MDDNYRSPTKMEMTWEQHRATGLQGVALKRHMKTLGVDVNDNYCYPVTLKRMRKRVGAGAVGDNGSVVERKTANLTDVMNLTNGQLILLEHQNTGLTAGKLRQHMIEKYGKRFESSGKSQYSPSGFTRFKLPAGVGLKPDKPVTAQELASGSINSKQIDPGSVSVAKTKRRQTSKPRTQQAVGIQFCPVCGTDVHLVNQAYLAAKELAR